MTKVHGYTDDVNVLEFRKFVVFHCNKCGQALKLAKQTIGYASGLEHIYIEPCKNCTNCFISEADDD
jgi:hypothetical protein